MGDKSKIEWTDATWNPIKARRRDTGKVGWHCERVSPACTHCYAATINMRNLPNGGTGLDYIASSRDLVEIFLDREVLDQPLRWRRPRKIFPCSMTDLFGEFVPMAIIRELWLVMREARHHTFQILTKRVERMAEVVAELSRTLGVLPNVHLGATVENQEYADRRRPFLLKTRAARRFISYEPALGPLNLWPWLSRPASHENGWHDGINWVIAGGESGSSARPAHPDWLRSVRDQCEKADVPFFFKQWGSWKPISEMPESEYSKFYVSNRKAPKGEEYRQPDLDECYGRRCTVPVEIIRFDGRHGHVAEGMFEMIDGHSSYSTFKLGKKKSGSTLDGKEWKEFPQS